MNYVAADCHNILQLFASPVKTRNTMLNLAKVSRGKGDDTVLVFKHNTTETVLYLDILPSPSKMRSKSAYARVLTYL